MPDNLRYIVSKDLSFLFKTIQLLYIFMYHVTLRWFHHTLDIKSVCTAGYAVEQTIHLL